MINPKSIYVIGAASGVGANNPGCSLGPIVLQTSPALQQLNFNLVWQPMLYSQKTDFGLAALPAIARLCDQIAACTYDFSSEQQPFLVLGGDHSCAIGTWSGAVSALKTKGSFGLIWVDAHMDSHTPQTSLSHNVHGMPLASLLGYGDSDLTEIFTPSVKLYPQHVCLVGVRSFEPVEAELLQRLNVRVFFMEEIKQKGIQTVMQEAKEIVSAGTAGYGLSIDLDAIDPIDAPGVSCPAPAGIIGKEFCNALTIFQQDPHLVGVEIAEFNPNLDKSHKTEQLTGAIIQSIFGDEP